MFQQALRSEVMCMVKWLATVSAVLSVASCYDTFCPLVQHVLDLAYELVERRVLAVSSSSALLASGANIFIATDRYMIGGC